MNRTNFSTRIRCDHCLEYIDFAGILTKTRLIEKARAHGWSIGATATCAQCQKMRKEVKALK